MIELDLRSLHLKPVAKLTVRLALITGIGITKTSKLLDVSYQTCRKLHHELPADLMKKPGPKLSPKAEAALKAMTINDLGLITPAAGEIAWTALMSEAAATLADCRSKTMPTLRRSVA